MALPDDFLRELRLRNNIVDVVGEYVRLKKRGKNHVGLCPFHGEKTASFTIYPETDSFYCFGCHVGGDVIEFIMRAERLAYIDAVKFLAQRANIKMPDNSFDDSAQKLRIRIYEANREAARFFFSQLTAPTGKAALAYLRGRKLSDKTIRSFGLGFAPNSWTALTDHLRSKGFDAAELIQSNLCVTNKRGNLIDRFRNRVMFPILDVRGNVIAFGGRIMTDEKPKYLNTSDTPAFKKSENLFALNIAKKSKSDKLILCEGYMDVIALHQAGFDFAVATLGTALTYEQAAVLKHYTNTVVLCYDSDQAGQNATVRAIDILRKENLDIKILKVPNGKDPDEFLRSHGENGHIKFKNLLEAAGNDILYRLDRLRQEYDINTDDGKIKFMTEAARMLAFLDNDIERDLYAGRLCGEMSIDRKSFNNQIDKFIRSRNKKEDREELRKIQSQLAGVNNGGERVKSTNVRAVKAEEALIGYLFRNPEMSESVRRQLPPERMTTDFNRRLYTSFTDRAMSGKGVSFTDFSGEFSSEENSRIAAIMANHANDISSNSGSEYISVILSESEKLSAEDLANESPEAIQEYLNKIKNKKSKK